MDSGCRSMDVIGCPEELGRPHGGASCSTTSPSNRSGDLTGDLASDGRDNRASPVAGRHVGLVRGLAVSGAWWTMVTGGKGVALSEGFLIFGANSHPM